MKQASSRNIKKQGKSQVTLMIGLYSKAKRKPHQVAVLVGEAFIGIRNKGEVYCHIDKNTMNNRASNLYITTWQQSIKRDFEIGVKKDNGIKQYRPKNTNHTYNYQQVKNGKVVSVFTPEELVRQYGKGGYNQVLMCAMKKEYIKDGKPYIYKSAMGYEWNAINIKDFVKHKKTG